MIKDSQRVILYGAGYRGSCTFDVLTGENVRVEAFCDMKADGEWSLFRGCDVVRIEDALKKWPKLSYVVCIDNEEENAKVCEQIKSKGIERVYSTYEEFYQGKKDIQVPLRRIGEKSGYHIYEPSLKKKRSPIVLSFGIGFEYSFETLMTREYNAKVWGFDPTPEVYEAIKRNDIDGFVFQPIGLSDKDGKKELHRPIGGLDYSEYLTSWTKQETISVDFCRLETIMKKKDICEIDVLKMDIEGSEFLAVPDILKSRIRVDQVCIETHARFFSDSVERMRAIKKLFNDNNYLLISNEVHEQTYISRSVLGNGLRGINH